VIRINLLGVERQKSKTSFTFDPAQRTTAACVLIVLLGVGGIGWWYWSLQQTSIRLDEELASAQQEQARLQTLLQEVRRSEQQRGQLQQRVALIEQLRAGQSVPVQLLDVVSRSLPSTLWLTQLNSKGTEVTIQGRSTTLVELSDFVATLGANGLLQRPIEILDSKVETVSGTGAQQGQSVDLINFTVKAQIAGGQGRAGGPPPGPGAPR
jgi:type IV pilus assembly protein PilN